MSNKFLNVLVAVTLASSLVTPIPKASADNLLGLPEPGTMVNLSPAYAPVLIKGLKLHPEDPFLFDFIIDTGSDHNAIPTKIEITRLIKYFLAAMTVPEKDLWVNLSPYEKNRMIASNLAQTEMGRDMLAQDYILKQLTASLIYPERNLGKTFWDEVYTKAQEQYGTTQIPVNTFNKVWIVADKADVFERANTAYVVGAHLKVMLEEDYLALNRHSEGVQSTTEESKGVLRSFADAQDDKAHNIASQIVRSIILPQLEKEINSGKNFAPLRQMFYSMILASWYKMALKDAILTQIYGNQSKVKVGVNQADPRTNDEIFSRYLRAYKKGVFNYIKEDIDKSSGETIPRKYFSGGEDLAMLKNVVHEVSTFDPSELSSSAVKVRVRTSPGQADETINPATGMKWGMYGWQKLKEMFPSMKDIRNEPKEDRRKAIAGNEWDAWIESKAYSEEKRDTARGEGEEEWVGPQSTAKLLPDWPVSLKKALSSTEALNESGLLTEITRLVRNGVLKARRVDRLRTPLTRFENDYEINRIETDPGHFTIALTRESIMQGIKNGKLRLNRNIGGIYHSSLSERVITVSPNSIEMFYDTPSDTIDGQSGIVVKKAFSTVVLAAPVSASASDKKGKKKQKILVDSLIRQKLIDMGFIDSNDKIRRALREFTRDEFINALPHGWAESARGQIFDILQQSQIRNLKRKTESKESLIFVMTVERNGTVYYVMELSPLDKEKPEDALDAKPLGGGVLIADEAMSTMVGVTTEASEGSEQAARIRAIKKAVMASEGTLVLIKYLLKEVNEAGENGFKRFPDSPKGTEELTGLLMKLGCKRETQTMYDVSNIMLGIRARMVLQALNRGDQNGYHTANAINDDLIFGMVFLTMGDLVRLLDRLITAGLVQKNGADFCLTKRGRMQVMIYGTKQNFFEKELVRLINSPPPPIELTHAQKVEIIRGDIIRRALNRRSYSVEFSELQKEIKGMADDYIRRTLIELHCVPSSEFMKTYDVRNVLLSQDERKMTTSEQVKVAIERIKEEENRNFVTLRDLRLMVEGKTDEDLRVSLYELGYDRLRTINGRNEEYYYPKNLLPKIPAAEPVEKFNVIKKRNSI